jgi:hypothetical protein
MPNRPLSLPSPETKVAGIPDTLAPKGRLRGLLKNKLTFFIPTHPRLSLLGADAL